MHKILPEGSPAELRSILEEDPNHFNDIPYDDVVEGIAHILLISTCLYVYGKERKDEHGDRAKYSRVKGIHTLPWDPAAKAHSNHAFNCTADVVREESRASKPDDEANTYSTSRKDMTRVLQFMPPLHFVERVISFLLKKAGKSATSSSRSQVSATSWTTSWTRSMSRRYLPAFRETLWMQQ